MVTNFILTFAEVSPGFVEAVVAEAEKNPAVDVAVFEYGDSTEVVVSADYLDLQNGLLVAAVIGNIAYQDFGLFLTVFSTEDEGVENV